MRSEPVPRILVIDDEQHQLDTVCRGLLFYDYACHGVLSVEAGLDALASQEDDGYDLVLTDLTMSGCSGLELIEQVQEQWPDLPIVVITGLAATVETRLVRQKNIPQLKKPFDPATLDATLRLALGRD